MNAGSFLQRNISGQRTELHEVTSVKMADTTPLPPAEAKISKGRHLERIVVSKTFSVIVLLLYVSGCELLFKKPRSKIKQGQRVSLKLSSGDRKRHRVHQHVSIDHLVGFMGNKMADEFRHKGSVSKFRTKTSWIGSGNENADLLDDKSCLCAGFIFLNIY